VRLWRELRGAAQSRQRSQRGAYKLANRGPRCRSARSHAARGRLVRLVRRKEDIESRMHDFVGTLDTLPRAQHPDPADHRINGDDLLKRRLATHQGVLIQFRSRDDKREKLLPRDRSKRSRSTRACARCAQVMSLEVNPPTTDPASADSAKIYATSMASPQPYES